MWCAHSHRNRPSPIVCASRENRSRVTKSFVIKKSQNPKYSRPRLGFARHLAISLRLSIPHTSQAVGLLTRTKINPDGFCFCASRENRTPATCLGSTRTTTILHSHIYQVYTIQKSFSTNG